MKASQTKDRVAEATRSVHDGAEDAVSAVRDVAAEAADQVHAGASIVTDVVPEVISMIRDGADGLAKRLPDALDAARAGAVATTDSLREMPQPTLQILAALSVGMGIGLYVAGAPRLVTIAAFTPALMVGVALTMSEPRGRPKHR